MPGNKLYNGNKNHLTTPVPTGLIVMLRRDKYWANVNQRN